MVILNALSQNSVLDSILQERKKVTGVQEKYFGKRLN